MAEPGPNLLRSSKSASEWTEHDLLSYNIQIEYQDSATFFGTDGGLPAPTVHPGILEHDDLPDDFDGPVDVCFFFHHLKWITPESLESNVDDFARIVYQVAGYTGRRVVWAAGGPLKLRVSGEVRAAKPNLTLIEARTGTLLLVQEDKRFAGQYEPIPQIVAEAMAVFEENNRTRGSRELGALPSAVVAGITMTGSLPTFLKIPITQQLINSVGQGSYPDSRTLVTAHRPELARPRKALEEGMGPRDNRRVIFSCFEAFKQFVLPEHGAG